MGLRGPHSIFGLTTSFPSETALLIWKQPALIGPRANIRILRDSHSRWLFEAGRLRRHCRRSKSHSIESVHSMAHIHTPKLTKSTPTMQGHFPILPALVSSAFDFIYLGQPTSPNNRFSKAARFVERPSRS